MARMGSLTRIPRRRFAALPLALLLVLTLAAPGRAGGLPGQDPAEYGTQASCMYRTAHISGPTPGYRLARIVVDPPTSLLARNPGQTVGWRFVVQDSLKNGWPFERIFAGRIHTSPATVSQPGVFTQKQARIIWDGAVEHPLQFGRFYRAFAKFYWYSSDGTLRRVERELLTPYWMYVNGQKTGWIIYGGCYEVWPNLPF